MPKTPNIPQEKWHQVEADYIHGKGSIAELAEKHKLVPSTVAGRATTYRWYSKRKEYNRQKALGAISTQPGLVPPMGPPPDMLLEGRASLTPEFFLKANAEYITRNYKNIHILQRIVDNPETDPELKVKTCEVIDRLTKSTFGIPSVKPIDRNRKGGHKTADVVPIEIGDFQPPPLEPEPEIQDVEPIPKKAESEDWD